MKKIFTSMFLMLALLAMTTGAAFAQEVTPITGTVQTVVLETDAVTGETSVAVTVLDETTNTSQTVKMSLETAVTLGLVVTDTTTGESTVTESAVGSTVEIDPTTIIPEDAAPTEEAQHPVGSSLSDFFSKLLGVDYDTIMTIHEDGVGFGVIARALWLTNSIDGGTDEFEALIEAKQSGDYSNITLADGSTPDNWGDVVKSMKKGDNLGKVMSGKDKPSDETPETIPTETPTETTTQSPLNGQGNGNGNNGNHGNNGNGQGNNGGNGGGNSHKP